ncbi:MULTISPECIES: NAD(P)/FAD-dependent oxidoreductase [unclassified Streptomyces]|uniref:NAD(P)/FAD-dependent oxidoreductase n=1 Tax=unclassified Streptomyces TaxID=2593676 RepID=UPI00382F5510
MSTAESRTAEYDVVISGASVAGCAAAILLARRGARVALLDRRSDPAAYKVLCTHYLQPCALPVLKELDLVEALEEAGAVRNEARWYTRWGWIEPKPGPDGEPLPHAYNVRRQTLDRIVRERAAATPGVDLLLGHTVVGLLRDGGRTTGVKADCGGSGERELRARVVVGADGKDSATARLAGVPVKTHANERFSYFAHFEDLELVGGITQSWFLEPDMAYAMPNDGGVTVVAVIPSKERLPQFRADLEGAYLDFVRDLPEAPAVDRATRVSKIIGTVNYPLMSRRPASPGLALIGDAALTSDPLWGVGCGWALQSASWLADVLAPVLAAAGGADEIDKALAGYGRRHRGALRGHQHLIADYAKGRPFNAFERLMFSAAARNDAMARHMHLFASRLVGPLRFLNPGALLRALWVNLTHRPTRPVPAPAPSGESPRFRPVA